MEIYPAIDLIGGRCVRLTGGDFGACRAYDVSPEDVAAGYAASGATWLHLVDLDGAREVSARQTATIARLVAKTRLNVQTGGGVRSAEDVRALLGAGVARVIVGSWAVRDPDGVLALMREVGAERLVLALDGREEGARGFRIATAGWTETSPLTLEALLDLYQGAVQHVLCTDIAQDGRLQGPNLGLYRRLVALAPQVACQASGGVATLEDIGALAETGVAAAVVGKALYEKRFALRDALERSRGC